VRKRSANSLTVHRQGGFVDPLGHVWLVGDRPSAQRRP